MPTLDPSLPPGLVLEAELSRSERGEVLRVRRGNETLVLRTGAGAATEAGLFAKLSAPGLVAPVDWGQTPDGRPYLLRPFVEGNTFDAAACSAEPERVASWARALLSILASLHEAGVVHRDIKASNVIVSGADVYLVDLDLVAGSGQATGAGSAFHIAPEVLLGQPHTPAADLFSMGVLLAIACCGRPAESFHDRFPRASFWTASGLDSDHVDPELRPLVRALVQRHPSQRPASARSAMRLLVPGAAAPLPDLELPFLEGRSEVLGELADLLDKPGCVVLTSVQDAEEYGPLLAALHLQLVTRGKRAVRLPSSARMAAEAAAPAANAEVLLLDLAAGAPVARAAELALEVLLGSGAALLLALPPQAARGVRQLIEQRLVPEENVLVRVWNWPRTPRAALGRHLARLTDGASPRVVERLAASLHERTSGRLADVNALLRVAVDAGVLRAEGSNYTVLLESWPEQASPQDALVKRLHALPTEALALLRSLACLGPPAAPALAAAVSGQNEALWPAALAALRSLGVTTDATGAPGQVDVPDRRWLEAARQGLLADEERALHRRCLEVRLASGASEVDLAHHSLRLAERDEDVVAVLALADAERRGGRLARARAILADALSVYPGGGPALEEQRAVLRARLDIAQGDASGAWASLVRTHGENFEDASHATVLVAAMAAEQSGRRGQARRLYQHVTDSNPTPEHESWARMGVAYGLLLDGQAEEVLATIGDRPGTGDPDEPAVALLNLRGVACTRLGRTDEAATHLEAALDWATRAGDPVACARTELNRAHLDRRRARHGQAVAALQRAIHAFTEAGHVQGRALALNNLGVLQRDLGDLTQARALLEESLALRRRVGDAHGAASSLASLALVALDAGQAGRALEALSRAESLLARGDYDAERALVALHRTSALALAGRHVEAVALMEEDRFRTARENHPALAARVEALVHFASSQGDLARAAARKAWTLTTGTGEAAETFRAAALCLTLQPADEDAHAALDDAASRLEAPVRRAEAGWRALRDAGEATLDQLGEWMEVFEQAGRTDLVRSVALALAARRDAAGEAQGRRAAHARAAEAADALTDGLPVHEKDRALQRVAVLAGGPVPRDSNAGLGVEWFLACNRRMALEDDLDGLLRTIVDTALDVTGARRGFLVLLEADSVAVQVARGMEQSEEESAFSRTVVRRAVAEESPVVTTDAARDQRFEGTASISALHLRSVLCVPFRAAGSVSGALYMDNDEQASAFDDEDIARVTVLADQAALAIRNLRRRKEIETLNQRLSERVEYQTEELERTRSLLRRKGDVAPVAGLVGDSEVMKDVFALVERLAPTELPVLVTGASGSGKDLVARALHERSRRAEGPLVVENVAALPATLLESELFGHVRGAFTGADRDRPGLFAEANGGTFVLDEIGEMPMELQAKLLRVLESGEFRPVGSRRPVHADVRIVAATNRDLFEHVREGKFREDLYYRLNAAEIRLPALADRLDDIPLLVRHFLGRLNHKYGTAKTIPDEVLMTLVRRAWPGQVRELSNEVSRLYFLSDAVLGADTQVRSPAGPRLEGPLPTSLKLEDAEASAIGRALEASGGRKDRAARMLGISRAGLYAKIKRLGLTEEEAAGG